MKIEYHSIVTLYEHDEPIVSYFLRGFGCTEEEMVQHLSNWDYGAEMEHSPSDEPGYGAADTVYVSKRGSPDTKDGDYILSYNRGLGYVSLERVTESD